MRTSPNKRIYAFAPLHPNVPAKFLFAMPIIYPMFGGDTSQIRLPLGEMAGLIVGGTEK